MSDTIIHIREALDDNYIYIVEKAGKALVIDAGESAPVLSLVLARELTVEAVLITHDHADHIMGAREIAETLHVPVLGPPGLQSGLTDRTIRDNERLAGLRVVPMETPGHAVPHTAYHLPDADAVFTGDCLFACGCGRLFGHPPRMMVSSLAALAALPGTVRIYPGHDYTRDNIDFALTVEPGNRALAERSARIDSLENQDLPTVPSTMSEELETNPFLRTGSVELRNRLDMSGADDVDVFAELRRRKDRF